jgi:orotate phosphoribosyltransferase
MENKKERPAAPTTTQGVRERLRELIRMRSFATGDFTLASGRKSTLYFNMKPTMMSAEGADLAAQALLEKAVALKAEYVGGLEMGAVPLIAALAALSHLKGHPIDTFFVRKKAKDHGTKAIVEGLAPGESLYGKRVVIADDVATSGQSILKAVEAAREAGATVEYAICIIDRDEGASEALAAERITLHSIFRASDFTG